METVNSTKNGSPERFEPLLFETPRNASERKLFTGTYMYTRKRLASQTFKSYLWKEDVQIVLPEIFDHTADISIISFCLKSADNIFRLLFDLLDR